MKYLFIFSLLISLFVFQSCSDDDENPDVDIENGFTFNGTFFSTTSLALDRFGTGDAALIVFGDGIYDPTIAEFVGESFDGILFDFQFDSGTMPPPGTYSFNGDDNTVDTFFNETILIDFNIATDQGIELRSNGGSVDVDFNSSSGVYTLDYTIQTNQGPIEGFYSGEIDIVFL